MPSTPLFACNYITAEDELDLYAFVISANIHRRHLTAADKDRLIAAVLKARPQLSDRQIAKQVKASPTKVGKERRKLEDTGDVSTVDTRTDSKGRAQPAHRAKPEKASVIVREQATAPELTPYELLAQVWATVSEGRPSAVSFRRHHHRADQSAVAGGPVALQ